MPKEQRMSDLIKTSALLHNKTVYYKDTSVDEVKELYEYLSNKIVNTSFIDTSFISILIKS